MLDNHTDQTELDTTDEDEKLLDKLLVQIDFCQDLGLTVRTTNALIHSDVRSIAELVCYTEKELSKFRCIGKKSLEEIKAFLAINLLSFCMDLSHFNITKYNVKKRVLELREDRKNPHMFVNLKLLRDDTISPECRFLLLLLLSKPANWKMTRSNIIKECDWFSHKKIKELIEEAMNAEYMQPINVFQNFVSRDDCVYLVKEDKQNLF